MAVTVDVQENPKVSKVGKAEADATVINSGSTSGTTIYQIARKDGQQVIEISSGADISKISQVLSVTTARLKIILPGRQYYKVRCHNGGTWSSWVDFKTRDKTYWTPVAVHEARQNFDTNPQQKKNKKIVVTNIGKSTVTETKKGATVVNTDTVYNGTTSITKSKKGVTVITDNFDGQ